MISKANEFFTLFFFLRNEQGGIAIAQESEVVSQGIVIHLVPITTLQEGAHQEEQRALRLMEIGNQHLHNLVDIAWGYDNLPVHCGPGSR